MVTSSAAPGEPGLTGFDTVVVAGGRSSRLGGTPKAGLPLGGSTLLAHTVAAARPFGTVVVVGPEDQELPADVLRTREDPPFSGPAAAIAAGTVALRGLPVRRAWTAVLACDMPAVDRALPTLVEAAARAEEAARAASSSSSSSPASSEVDGVVAVSTEGRREHLAVLLRTGALERALEAAPTTDASVRSVWRHLRWRETPVPEGSTADVDTWDDVRRLDLY
ncbi:molybdenum cofactor guanylyltransferase [Kocuria varians]|uniref:molybdenum cofactor guanylyltransferase n=1 Tax=Kocuria varians TaxID=1272 RepID=UPI000838C258|nr:NTP transferase domain-containing protein [Kocuria varians]